MPYIPSLVNFSNRDHIYFFILRDTLSNVSIIKLRFPVTFLYFNVLLLKVTQSGHFFQENIDTVHNLERFNLCKLAKNSQWLSRLFRFCSFYAHFPQPTVYFIFPLLLDFLQKIFFSNDFEQFFLLCFSKYQLQLMVSLNISKK